MSRWVLLPWTLIKVAGFKFCICAAEDHLKALSHAGWPASHPIWSESTAQLERDLIRLYEARQQLPWR